MDRSDLGRIVWMRFFVARKTVVALTFEGTTKCLKKVYNSVGIGLGEPQGFWKVPREGHFSLVTLGLDAC